MGSSLNTELVIHGSIIWRMERSLGAARGSLISQMDEFYPVGNSLGKSLLLSLTAGQRQRELAPSGSCSSRKNNF